MTLQIKNTADGLGGSIEIGGQPRLVFENDGTLSAPQAVLPSEEDSSKLATTEWVKSLLLGVGQTWKNMTAVYAPNTLYTNNTGKPIQISLRSQGAVGGQANAFIYADGINVTHQVGIAGATGGTNVANVVATIPPNGQWKYDTGAGTTITWELS